MRSDQRSVLISRAVAEFSALEHYRQRAGSARELSTQAVRFVVSTDQFAPAASVAFPAAELPARGAPDWPRFPSAPLAGAGSRELRKAHCATSRSDNRASGPRNVDRRRKRIRQPEPARKPKETRIVSARRDHALALLARFDVLMELCALFLVWSSAFTRRGLAGPPEGGTPNCLSI